MVRHVMIMYVRVMHGIKGNACLDRNFRARLHMARHSRTMNIYARHAMVIYLRARHAIIMHVRSMIVMLECM
jgi:hypothetical protein